MTFKELKHFLGEINIKIDDLYAEKLFNECDRSHSKMLEGPEIEEFYKRLTHRNEIEVIYSKYAGSKGKMSVEDLGNFLRMEQPKEKKLMSRDGFLMYLQSSDGLVLNPTHTLVYQDMSQPLNHYFISSSHNTYLMEDQLKGPSSTEAYVRAFTKGCRCVELDCWDGPNGDPVIYHGYTLTSKILFKDVIKTVKEYAFKSSDGLVLNPTHTLVYQDMSQPLNHYFISSSHNTYLMEDQLKGPSSTEAYVREGKAFKLAQESANSFVIHNTRQLSRTYPRGIRTDSSNYNPVDLWSAGCQIGTVNTTPPITIL
ncbi:UNVERIFIED_CONTAM: hypothetical protein FKN15_042980 [Acipenser sinensis]